MRTSTLAQNLSPSMTLVIADKARDMKKEGINVISFATGEPDFDTPQNIKDAAIKALQDGMTSYSQSGGLPEVKAAIVKKLKNENGLDYTPKQILVGNGAKQVLFEAMLAILSPGDEVILPTPCWVSYTEQVGMAGGVAVLVETTQENNFVPDSKEIAKKITSKTKAIVINSPNNPTGAVFTKECLEEIAALAVKHDFFVISDEVYEKIIYDESDKSYSIASFGQEIYDRTITINGWSKTFAMTGWRMGYAAGPQDVISAMDEIHGHVTGNVCTFIQKGGIVALEDSKDYIGYVKEYNVRRKYMVDRLNGMNGISCRMPKGAFYVFADMTALIGKKYNGMEIKNSIDLASFLLDEARIAIVPSESFMAEGFIRLSYAVSMKNIEDGMDSMEKALKLLV